jgi:hypothetical protein
VAVAAHAFQNSCFGASGVLVGSELSEKINNKDVRFVHKNKKIIGLLFCVTGFWPLVVQVLLLGAFAELRKKETSSSVMSVCPSVYPFGTTRLPLDGFS